MPMAAQGMLLTPVLPFFVVLCLGVLIITVYPEIATWRPRTMLNAR